MIRRKLTYTCLWKLKLEMLNSMTSDSDLIGISSRMVHKQLLMSCLNSYHKTFESNACKGNVTPRLWYPVFHLLGRFMPTIELVLTGFEIESEVTVSTSSALKAPRSYGFSIFSPSIVAPEFSDCFRTK